MSTVPGAAELAPLLERAFSLLESTGNGDVSVEDAVAHLEHLALVVQQYPSTRPQVQARAALSPAPALLQLTTTLHLHVVGPDLSATLARVEPDPDLVVLVASEAMFNPHLTLASVLDELRDTPPSEDAEAPA